MSDNGLFENVSPRITRLVALGVLTLGGFCIVVCSLLVVLGDERGLLLSILGVLTIWVSILIDRDARGVEEKQASGGTVGRRLPVVVTRVTGLLVLALGGFLLVASLVHYFGEEPSAWLGLSSVPFAILLIWLGFTIDRDRLRLEGRRRREVEGDAESDRKES